MQKTPARTYEQQEAQFFRQRGYTTAGIAGALGNLEKESSWKPTAYNPNEGAIGIAQWENARRIALDNTAREMGTSETNINAQLAYMNKELTDGYSEVDNYMRTATDPAAAANEWNRHYEISGDYSQDRENNAASIFQELTNGSPLTGGGSYIPPGGNNGSGGWQGLSGGDKTIGDNPPYDPNSLKLPLDKTQRAKIITWMVGQEALGGISPTPATEPNALEKASDTVLLQGYTMFTKLHGFMNTPITGPGTSIGDWVGGLSTIFGSIGSFFEKLLWIFNVSHFWKFMLYTFGAVSVVAGLSMITFGSSFGVVE